MKIYGSKKYFLFLEKHSFFEERVFIEKNISFGRLFQLFSFRHCSLQFFDSAPFDII